jgi:hypothetical protein
MKLRAAYWLIKAFVISFLAVECFILGEYYSQLCGISFPYVASHSSRLAILAQR